MSNIPVVILAGGYGTRLKEYPEPIPKPMVPIGGKPVLWHIMKGYSHYGFTNFIICLGYRGEKIRDYFLNFNVLNNDVTITPVRNEVKILGSSAGRSEADWKVTLIETGRDTLTGGRIKRVAPYINSDTFFISYGDNLCNINFQHQLAYHLEKKAELTVTGVRQHSRFGHLDYNQSGKVTQFIEKPLLSDVVSGGFFVAEKKFLDRIENDQTTLETTPIQQLTAEGGLFCYQHEGFWTYMDTYRDYEYLNQLYEKEECPWMVWAN